MSNRNLLVLGIVAAITVTWAVILSNRVYFNANRPQRTSFEESYLIQGLDLSSIASIQIGAGDEPLTLVRRGTQFTVTSKNDYPADTQKINRLLVDLTDLRVSKLVTDDEDNHESLNVSEEGAESLIQFFDNSGKVITGIAIGSQHVVEGGTGPSQNYVRLLSSPNVFLAEGVPNISDSALEYVNKELINFEVNELGKVEVSRPDSGYVVKALRDGEETRYALEDTPQGRELDDNKARSLLSAFTNVALKDVHKAEDVGQGLNSLGIAVCTLEDQVAYRFELLQKDDKAYLRLSAEYLGDTQIVKENRVESDEELKAKEAKLLARDTAESFTRRHQGWVYEIFNWKAEELTPARDELLKELETSDETVPGSENEAVPSATN